MTITDPLKLLAEIQYEIGYGYTQAYDACSQLRDAIASLESRCEEEGAWKRAHREVMLKLERELKAAEQREKEAVRLAREDEHLKTLSCDDAQLHYRDVRREAYRRGQERMRLRAQAISNRFLDLPLEEEADEKV